FCSASVRIEQTLITISLLALANKVLFVAYQDGLISYKEFQSTMKAGTEWKKASLGTLVSGFDDFPLEAAARNNGTGCNGYEYDAIVMAIGVSSRVCKGKGAIAFWAGLNLLIQQERRVHTNSNLRHPKRFFDYTSVGEGWHVEERDGICE
ncbi:hypothetical protein Tco_1076477, partial [Tanacetum coccineum]